MSHTNVAVAVAAILFISGPALAVKVKATIKVEALNQGGWVEFKSESDQKGEMATGRLTDPGEKTFEWEMGESNQNIWFWWDTLNGTASIKIWVDDSLVFDGTCSHNRNGEVKVKSTCESPRTYKTDGSPYLVEEELVTQIRFSGKKRVKGGSRQSVRS